MFHYRFNDAVEKIQPSTTAQMMARARKMAASGIDVVDLTGGEPDFDTPDRIRYEAISSITHGETHYSVSPGEPELRARIAQYMQESYHALCTPENILVTPGAKYLIYLAIRALINRGDEVMYLKPGYISYPSIITACDGVPAPVQLEDANNFKVTRAALEACFTDRTRVLLVNSPSNPLGTILSQEEAQTVADFVKDHEIVLISDEIYSEIIYDGKKHISFGSFPEIVDQTIVVNGFSKSVAMTGWRLGYGSVPAEIRTRILRLIQHTVLCCNTFVQKAAIVAFDCKDETEAMRGIFEQRRNYFIAALNAIPGVTARMPQGAFYAWVKIEKNGLSSEQIADHLLESGHVACVPGANMGGKNYIRFSYATSMENLEKGIERIRTALEAL